MKQSKFAVTGGIGSGKSTFLKILSSFGYPVYSCDEINKELLNDPEYLGELQKLFPDCFEDGRLIKKKLSERIFRGGGDAERLEKLAHPRIMKTLFARAQDEVYFAEVPLLYEGGFSRLFDRVIAIVRSDEARLSSVAARDKLSERDIKDRMRRQRSDYENDPNCIIVSNNGSFAELEEKARKLLRELKID